MEEWGESTPSDIDIWSYDLSLFFIAGDLSYFLRGVPRSPTENGYTPVRFAPNFFFVPCPVFLDLAAPVVKI